MSSETIAISAKNLSKTYKLYERPLDRLKQILLPNGQSYGQDFIALQDVSFELQRGEVLGLVGRNGAGKSTLLQMICGTLSPTSGSVVVNGRLAALLELGAGFNQDFTGRENIYLNATILGLTKAEIDARYSSIVEFSGIEDFINQPVKTYSSGMYMRLAFSIATSVEPQILVIDEALSVGDGAFARKSFDRIMRLRNNGATILFCSHSLYQVEALCTRAVWLEGGKVQAMGAPADVVASYQASLDRAAAPAISLQALSSGGENTAPMVSASGHARIVAVEVSTRGKAATALHMVSGHDTLQIDLSYASDPLLPTPVAAITLNATDGRILASTGTHVDGVLLERDASGRGNVRLVFPALPLLKGEYLLWVYLLSEDGIHHYDVAGNVATLHITQEHLEQGVVSLPHRWSNTTAAHDDS